MIITKRVLYPPPSLTDEMVDTIMSNVNTAGGHFVEYKNATGVYGLGEYT